MLATRTDKAILSSRPSHKELLKEIDRLEQVIERKNTIIEALDLVNSKQEEQLNEKKEKTL